MTELDAIAIPGLTAAGWHPGRSTSSDAREAYALADLRPPPCGVLTFLSEFGGLTFDVPHKRTGHPHPCIFCAMCEDEEWLAYWADIAGTELTPIGGAQSWMYTLMMSPDGRTFQAAENVVQYIGVDGVDAINGLLSRRDPLWTQYGSPDW